MAHLLTLQSVLLYVMKFVRLKHIYGDFYAVNMILVILLSSKESCDFLLLVLKGFIFCILRNMYIAFVFILFMLVGLLYYNIIASSETDGKCVYVQFFAELSTCYSGA